MNLCYRDDLHLFNLFFELYAHLIGFYRQINTHRSRIWHWIMIQESVLVYSIVCWCFFRHHLILPRDAMPYSCPDREYSRRTLSKSVSLVKYKTLDPSDVVSRNHSQSNVGRHVPQTPVLPSLRFASIIINLSLLNSPTQNLSTTKRKL